MINASISIKLLLCCTFMATTQMQAGKNTANVMYYGTKAGIIGGAVATAAYGMPFVAAYALTGSLGFSVANAAAMGSVSTLSASAAINVGYAASENLAMKAYNAGMKL